MLKTLLGERLRWGLAAWAAVLLLGATVLLGADTPGDALNTVGLLGIGRASGDLIFYDFAAAKLTAIGTVQESGGQTLTGVDAAAYFPGYQNLFVLWANPTDGKNKLVYVDVNTAAATVTADDVEGGHFTGAVGALTTGPTGAWTMFAVQNAKVKPPSTISGLLNINPNNSPNNEFTMTKDNGASVTRDHLAAKDLTLPADGTYYRGGATFVHVKPKGNGNQNGVLLDGQTVVLQNSNTYDFSGSMEVRLYNDKVNNGKAMGHWWLQIISGHAYVNDNVEVLFPNRIVTVNHDDGTVNELMKLSRSYRGLATVDGLVFYTTSGRDLYKIDTVAQTETKLGTTTLNTPSDAKFVGAHLFLYDIGLRTLGAVSAADAHGTSTQVSYGLGDLGVMAFTPAGEYPVASAGSYD